MKKRGIKMVIKNVIKKELKKEIYTSREIQQILRPLVHSLERLPQKKQKAKKKTGKNKTVIIGLQGGQGTGKTTLARYLQGQLGKRGWKVIRFSIDDFYSSAAARRSLARKYPANPFYQISRGMPGTHRVRLLKKTLQRLQQGKDVQLPVFDKSRSRGFGDIVKRTIPVTGQQDFIILEGWCVGMPLVSSKRLREVCMKNKIGLEKLDPAFRYHKIVLNHLKPYQPLWKFIDYLIMLRPDSADLHLRWRIQQEREMERKTGRKGMTDREIEQFVLAYLPFTYVGYEKIKADRTLLVDKKHRIYQMK